jgi:hypothetical protein
MARNSFHESNLFARHQIKITQSNWSKSSYNLIHVNITLPKSLTYKLVLLILIFHKPNTLPSQIPQTNHLTMATATQTSLFTPPLSGPKPNDRISVPWKQSPTLSFTNPNPLSLRLTISRNIKTTTVIEEATEAPIGFTPPE